MVFTASGESLAVLEVMKLSESTGYNAVSYYYYWESEDISLCFPYT
jgi:hypothetical protein